MCGAVTGALPFLCSVVLADKRELAAREWVEIDLDVAGTWDSLDREVCIMVFCWACDGA